MPKRKPFDRAEVESVLEFMTALDEDPTKVSGAGRSKDDRSLLAHELLCAAEDAVHPPEAIPFLLRAVRLDPACLDARSILANIAGGPRDEMIEEFQQILAAGEASLGQAFFEENHGYFWLDIESRPYMRVRARLAKLLQDEGRTDEAISHFEAMLALNPNDNQGMRYELMSCYLETGKLDEARTLLKRYSEQSALWLWAKVLERYLATELTEAAGVLAKARGENRYFEDFLLKRKALPKDPPDFYSPGSASEGHVCIDTLGRAWNAYPEAVAWLGRQAAGTEKSSRPKTSKKKTATIVQ